MEHNWEYIQLVFCLFLIQFFIKFSMITADVFFQ